MKKLLLLAIALSLPLAQVMSAEPQEKKKKTNRHVAAETRNVVNRNRNFDRNSFVTAKKRVIVVRHDRVWWRTHFPSTRFVLFGGGYYYWWDGYWYPALGYDPYYSTYGYYEPIYGYNNLAPGQVIENVQVALRNQGYYHGVIDGLIGPRTRDALARYQRDHGLLVTSAIDQPTLATLGLA